MNIFFPDNDKRHDRLVQLAADAQGYLSDAKREYAEFRQLMAVANDRIATVFSKAGLQSPAVSQVDILASQATLRGIDTAQTVVAVSNLVIGVAGTFATFTVFAPAAAAALVDLGVIGAETASAVLFSVLGAEVTVGALAGGIVAGLIVGAVVAAIGLAIDAIEGAVERDHLRLGIHHCCQLRASLRYALDRSTAARELVSGIVDTCDTLLKGGVELNEQIITNLLQRAVEPALRRIEDITKESVEAELHALDTGRSSWTEDDTPDGAVDLPQAVPIYVACGTREPERLIPKVPDTLKLTALTDSSRLDVTPNYPVLKVDAVTYWPLSYIDNRDGMAIVAFGPDGTEVERFERTGARYIYSIERDVGTGDIAFVGQSERKILVHWAELTNITFDAATHIPLRNAPPVPDGLKLASLADPDRLDPAPAYPVLLIGRVRYWPLSYIDNREGMAILAYDDGNRILRRWELQGARYIWRIEESLAQKSVAFIGQGRNRVTLSYDELNRL